MKKKLFILAFLVITATACDKNEDPTDFPQNWVLKSQKIYNTDGSFYFTEYTFNSNDKLLEDKTVHPNGQILSFRKYEYEGDKLARHSLHSPNAKVAEFRYSYTNNRLQKVEYVEFKTGEQPQLILERTYEYSGNQISKINETNHNINTSSYTLYAYEGDNISQIKGYDLPANTLAYDIWFEYDTKYNPLYNTLVDNGNARYNSRNNITKVNTVYHKTSDQDYQYNYEYNQAGYPIKQYLIVGGKSYLEQEFIFNR